MAKKLALGKGMSALLGDSSAASEKEVTVKAEKKALTENNDGATEIEIKDIITNPNQPRKIFKEKELQELSNSIQENGVIQPLIVAKTDKGFELVAGERRLRASKMAGLKKVPVVLKLATDRDKMVMSIIENVQRADLNCIEEALAYHQLMSEYNLTQEEVAKRVGKERSTIANFLRILKLPRAIIDLTQKDLLSFGHAKILAAVKDRDLAIRLANEAVTKGFSVRELEKNIKMATSTKKKFTDRNPFFDEKLDQFKQQLEKNTGFHFALSSKKNGTGIVSMKFSNEAEFNDIFEYLLNR
jgi:ParB family transcriptional regulator, chromosome partitioning protein